MPILKISNKQIKGGTVNLFTKRVINEKILQSKKKNERMIKVYFF